MEKELLLDMSAAFGGGFARHAQPLRSGKRHRHGDIPFHARLRAAGKGEVYAVVRRYTDRFEEEFRSLNCGELLKGVKGHNQHAAAR